MPTRTPQQQAFVQALKDGTSNIALSAVAGSGKTFTLVEGATEIQVQGLALAFNKRNQEELARRMPKTIVCKTMNALGHAAWGKQVGKGLSVDGGKQRSLIARMWPNWDERMKTPGLDRFVDILRLHEVVPAGAAFQGRENKDSDEYFTQLFEDYEFDSFEKELDQKLYFERARQVLHESIKMAWQRQIDFVDQLYMPIAYSAPFTPEAFVMVDECQDLSPIQHKMVKRTAWRGRIVSAGDPRQAIYGFAGAMSNSMEHLIREFSMEEMPLTWCFRCPESVVRAAQKYNPLIQPAPGAAKGKVHYVEGLEQVKMGDVVISYRNAALLEAAFALIARGIGAKLVGSGDLGAQLVKLARKFPFPRDNYLKAITDWSDAQFRELVAAGKPGQADRARDKATCLKIICLKSGAESHGQMEDEIKKIFAMDGSVAPVTCTTIHKAKGLEWPRVHIYRFHDVFRGFDFMSFEQQQQRRNMAYVQITRAQEELFFTKPSKKEEFED